MNNQELLPHLFRTEFSKIASVLVRHLGIDHIEVAEDIASETFLLALETWSYKGIPENPIAWLYTVAKNKAKNQIKRKQLFDQKVVPKSKVSHSNHSEIDIDLSQENITDSQLQMLFALCHPSIPAEAQIGLSLRILCGFGIDEIATAFLTNKETINKRLFRAKEKLRLEKVKIEFPSDHEIKTRLENVLKTLYLFFSEGYYSESNNDVLRKDLCLEAMRLTYLLIECKQTNQPEVNALFSLMCFHASRFDARQNEKGELILYDDQDETKWNYELISRGSYFLKQASRGNTVSKYHIEASIAYWHTNKSDTKQKWLNIVELYDHLLQIEPSPIVELNRAFAISKVYGKEEGIRIAEQLMLRDNHYFYVLLGELYKDIDKEEALNNFLQALLLARTNMDKLIIQKKIDSISAD